MNAYIFRADLYCEECARQIMFDLLADALTKAGAKQARQDLVFDGEAYVISLPPEEISVIDHFITPDGDIPNYLPCSGFTVSTETEMDSEENPVNHTLYLYPPEDEMAYDSGEWPKGPYDQDYNEADGPQNCGSGEACVHSFENGDSKIKAGVFLENTLTSDGYSYLQEILNEHGPNLPPAAKEWAEYYSFTYHKQQWSHPREWLDEKLMDLSPATDSHNFSRSGLWEYASAMASTLDGDQIQDLFESDMDDDGYFKKAGWYSDEMR